MLMAVSSAAGQEQEPASRTQTAPEWKRAIYVKTAYLNYRVDGSWDFVTFLPLTVEYDQAINRKFSWVGGLSVGFPARLWDEDEGCSRSERRRGTTLAVNAKIAFTQPLIRQRLFFRVESGFAGVFRLGREPEYWSDGAHGRFVPAFALELYLMLRFNNGFEIMVSPFLAYPSMLRISPAGRNGDPYLETNILPFSVGFRF